MGNVVQEPEPARPRPPFGRRLAAFFGSAFIAAGLLLAGAGVCCGVFSFHFFDDADQLQQSAGFARNQAGRLSNSPPGSTITNDGVPLTQTGWVELANQRDREALFKRVVGFKNLAISLGLFFGGTTLCGLGWGLRSRGRGRTATA